MVWETLEELELVRLASARAVELTGSDVERAVAFEGVGGVVTC